MAKPPSSSGGAPSTKASTPSRAWRTHGHSSPNLPAGKVVRGDSSPNLGAGRVVRCPITPSPRHVRPNPDIGMVGRPRSAERLPAQHQVHAPRQGLEDGLDVHPRSYDSQSVGPWVNSCGTISSMVPMDAMREHPMAMPGHWEHMPLITQSSNDGVGMHLAPLEETALCSASLSAKGYQVKYKNGGIEREEAAGDCDGSSQAKQRFSRVSFGLPCDSAPHASIAMPLSEVDARLQSSPSTPSWHNDQSPLRQCATELPAAGEIAEAFGDTEKAQDVTEFVEDFRSRRVSFALPSDCDHPDGKHSSHHKRGDMSGRHSRHSAPPRGLVSPIGHSEEDGDEHVKHMPQPWSSALAAAAAAAGGSSVDQGCLPVPPSGISWDWPLSRHEKKARIVMIDRNVLIADQGALEEKLEMMRALLQQ